MPLLLTGCNQSSQQQLPAMPEKIILHKVAVDDSINDFILGDSIAAVIKKINVAFYTWNPESESDSSYSIFITLLSNSVEDTLNGNVVASSTTMFNFRDSVLLSYQVELSGFNFDTLKKAIAKKYSAYNYIQTSGKTYTNDTIVRDGYMLKRYYTFHKVGKDTSYEWTNLYEIAN